MWKLENDGALIQFFAYEFKLRIIICMRDGKIAAYFMKYYRLWT